MTAEDVPPSADAPPVFTRVLSTPPGMPWDQMRVAGLEAARAAPMAIESLTLRLKRLSPWRNGKSGSFVAFYVKTEALGGGFRASKVIDGRTVAVDSKSRARARAEAKLLAVLAGVCTGAAVLALAAAITAVAVRHSADKRLDQLTGRSTQQLRQAQVLSVMKRQNNALQAADNPGAPISEVLADLAWASRMRRQDVPVEGFHWRPAGFGVEVRGEASPFTGPGALRAARPLKPGVWLWIRAHGPVARAASQGQGR